MFGFIKGMKKKFTNAGIDLNVYLYLGGSNEELGNRKYEFPMNALELHDTANQCKQRIIQLEDAGSNWWKQGRKNNRIYLPGDYWYLASRLLLEDMEFGAITKSEEYIFSYMVNKQIPVEVIQGVCLLIRLATFDFEQNDHVAVQINDQLDVRVRLMGHGNLERNIDFHLGNLNEKYDDLKLDA